LVIFILFLLISGGAIIKTDFGKIEFSSLDPWVLALGLIVFIRLRASTQRLPALNWISHFIVKFNDITFSKLFSILALSTTGFLLFFAHVFKEWSFNTHGYDQGFVHQPIFNVFTPNLLTCNLCATNSYFSEHLSFILVPVGLITSLISYDEVVFLLQTIILILVPILTLIYSPLKNKKNLWPIFVIAILSHKSYRSGFIWDFREDNLALLFLTITGLSLLNKNWIGYIVFLTLSLLCKENIGLVSVFFVFPIMLDKSLHIKYGTRVRISLITVSICLIYTLIAFKFLMPYFGEGATRTTQLVTRFPRFGSTPNEVLNNLFTRPMLLFNLISTEFFRISVFKYLIFLFLPFIWFLLRSPWWIIPTLPGLAMNILSNADTQISMNFHYDQIILPFLIIGSVSAAIAPKTRFSSRSISLILLFALAVSGRWPGFFVTHYFPSISSIQDSFFLRNLDENVPIIAPWHVLGQLAYKKSLIPLNATEFDVESDDESVCLETLQLVNFKLKDSNISIVFDRKSPVLSEANLSELIWKCRNSKGNELLYQNSNSNRFFVIKSN